MDVDRDVLSVHPRELDRGTHEVLLLVLADVHSESWDEHGEGGEQRARSARMLRSTRRCLPGVANVRRAAEQLSTPCPLPCSASKSVVEKAVIVGEE